VTRAKPKWRLLLSVELSPDAGLRSNAVELTGQLLERGALRHTPAGIAVLEFRLQHVSDQEEAGSKRRIECEMPCVAVGQPALLLADAKPGTALRTNGFMAAKSLKNRNPVLHVNKIEFLEGNNHGV
jgi:primosomal replication protein N